MFQYIQLKNNILKIEGEILCLEKKRKDEGWFLCVALTTMNRNRDCDQNITADCDYNLTSPSGKNNI